MKETKNTLETIQSRIDLALSERAAEIEKLEANIKQYEESKFAAVEEMTEATAADDLEKYRKAKAIRDLAEDSKSMYITQLEQLKLKPMMSESEYLDIKSEILFDVSARQTDAERKAVDLIAKIEALADEVEAYRIKAQDVLRAVQINVYRDPAVVNAKTHELARLKTEKLEAGEVESFAYRIRTFPEYQNLKK